MMKSIINNIKEPYNIPRQQLLSFQSGDIEIVKENYKKGSFTGNYVLPLIVKTYNILIQWKILRKI